jgi:hypothetical protein
MASNANFKHSKGSNFAKLTGDNYSDWVNHMVLLLKSLHAWTIVKGEELCPEGGSAASLKAIRLWQEWVDDAAVVIFEACAPEIQCHLKHDMIAVQMWKELEDKLEKTKNIAGWWGIYDSFWDSRPVLGQPIREWIAKLISIKARLHGSEQEIYDHNIINHIMYHLPESFERTKHNLQDTKAVTIAQMTATLQRHEDNHKRELLQKGKSSVGEAHHTSKGRWCHICQKSTHNTNSCYSKRNGNRKRNCSPDQRSGSSIKNRRSNDDIQCYHCTAKGHISSDCLVKKAGEAIRLQNRGGRRDDKRNSNIKPGHTYIADGDSEDPGL